MNKIQSYVIIAVLSLTVCILIFQLHESQKEIKSLKHTIEVMQFHKLVDDEISNF